VKGTPGDDALGAPGPASAGPGAPAGAAPGEDALAEPHGRPQTRPRDPGEAALSPTGRVQRPVVLLVLDGWGVAPPGPGNAVSVAETPVMDGLTARYPHGLLDASGPAVGLPPGQMGNSEVGHLNIGAGRVVYQDLTRITKAVADGDFFRNRVLCQAFDKAAGRGSTLHLMGLVSEGGVHSDLGHLEACLDLAARRQVRSVLVQAFLDGRDTLPRSAKAYLARVQVAMDDLGVGRFGVVSGRYYAMDRDTRWERVKQAYDALVYGRGFFAADAQAAVDAAYRRGEDDEFVRPTLVAPELGHNVADGDVCLFFNFRPDRARELTRAFAEPGFAEFDRGPHPPAVDFVTMTEYKREFRLPVAFPPEHPRHVLAEVLAEHGLRQLHVAETEKYAHVTFFFNGGVEREAEGETRILVPSPRDVPTYDHEPEMSAFGVTDELVDELETGAYDFAIVNYANADMVGHTGVIGAAVTAVEAVDACVGQVVDLVTRLGGACLITADHGNSDHMLEADGSPNTAHSTNPVPFIATVEGVRVREGGRLCDLAPTALALLGLPAPAEMTGVSLLGPPDGG
jgi:2,3-bisphosphoglycerate-independent phosphoglycerate mutase